MISPPKRYANARLRALFPVAVGPRIATTVFTRELGAEEDERDEDPQKQNQAELLAPGRHQ